VTGWRRGCLLLRFGSRVKNRPTTRRPRLTITKTDPKGSTSNARYPTDEILSEIAAWREADRGRINRRFVAHRDNARLILHPHQILHRQTFFYSVILKARSEDDILRVETGANEKVTLEKVFLEWMDRLAKSISTNGADVGGDE
jgi:hypothetical protein